MKIYIPQSNYYNKSSNLKKNVKKGGNLLLNSNGYGSSYQSIDDYENIVKKDMKNNKTLPKLDVKGGSLVDKNFMLSKKLQDLTLQKKPVNRKTNNINFDM